MSRVCVQASVLGSPRDETRLVWGSLLRTSICLQVPGLCTSSVYSPTSQTRLILVSYFVYMHRSPTLCLKHVRIVDPCLCMVSVLSQNGYEWYYLHGSDVYFAFRPCNIWPRYEGGDGHKHGCLDAFAITLSFRWSLQSRATSGYSCLFCITSMY